MDNRTIHATLVGTLQRMLNAGHTLYTPRNRRRNQHGIFLYDTLIYTKQTPDLEHGHHIYSMHCTKRKPRLSGAHPAPIRGGLLSIQVAYATPSSDIRWYNTYAGMIDELPDNIDALLLNPVVRMRHFDRWWFVNSARLPAHVATSATHATLTETILDNYR